MRLSSCWETMPKVITVNPFELKSPNFQRFALWLDIVERMGSNYCLLRAKAAQLVPLPDPPREPVPEEVD